MNGAARHVGCEKEAAFSSQPLSSVEKSPLQGEDDFVHASSCPSFCRGTSSAIVFPTREGRTRPSLPKNDNVPNYRTLYDDDSEGRAGENHVRTEAVSLAGENAYAVRIPRVQSSSFSAELLLNNSGGNLGESRQSESRACDRDERMDPERARALAILSAYEKVVTWRRNVFNVPFGAHGNAFVDVLAGLIQAFADGNKQRGICWKAVCVACHLLLQKPNGEGSAANHARHLQRRLTLWEEDKIEELVDEAECIQSHLPHSLKSSGRRRKVDGPSDTLFSKLVFEGKLNSAIRHLSEEPSGILSMDDHPVPGSEKTVREVLLEKHPESKQPPPSVLSKEEPPPVNPILFEQLTPKLLKEVGRRASGSAGPSGLDAEAWKRMMTCFKKSSDRLCAALAAAAKCLCVEDLSSEDLSAFTAARLIPLNKKPGVRPIAVGEVFRRIICKAIMKVIERDILCATAPFQVCVGVPSACEAAVHALDKLFENSSVEGVLLVDASNAFNALNRSAALHNVPRVCPAMGKVFTNTYSSPSRLFVTGGGEILSREGTCQGDPLAMAIYAVAITPMIQHLSATCPAIKQCWYADDDGASGSLEKLHHYWMELNEIGPGYGYFPHAVKTILLTKGDLQDKARELFSDTGVTIRTEGCRYLGGALGSDDFRRSYMESMVDKWCTELLALARIAESQPHAAFTAFTKGLSSRWTYHLRSTACPAEVFSVLDSVINESLLPALTGRDFRSDEPVRSLIALPARMGGLAIPVIGDIAHDEYTSSKKITEPLVNMIASVTSGETAAQDLEASPVLQEASPVLHATSPVIQVASPVFEVPSPVLPAISPVLQTVSESRRRKREERSRKNERQTAQLSLVQGDLSDKQQLLTNIAMEKGVSSWLTATPS